MRFIIRCIKFHWYLFETKKSTGLCNSVAKQGTKPSSFSGCRISCNIHACVCACIHIYATLYTKYNYVPGKLHKELPHIAKLHFFRYMTVLEIFVPCFPRSRQWDTRAKRNVHVWCLHFITLPILFCRNSNFPISPWRWHQYCKPDDPIVKFKLIFKSLTWQW